MKKVALSAGHYQAKPGACHEGKCEHKLAKNWVNEIWTALRSKEDRPHITLVSSGPLKDKVATINALYGDLALEVHFNACGGCGASGCETLYYPGSQKGEVAAGIMQKHLQAAMGNKNRGIKEGWYKMDRPGVVDFYGDEDGDEMPDYFLRKTNCTALILEPEFIEHLDVINDKMKVGAEAIANAVMEILKR